MNRSTRNFARAVAMGVLFCAVWLCDVRAASTSRGGDIQFDVQPTESIFTYEPLTHRDAQWLDSTFWEGTEWTRVGKNWHHPGPGTPSVRCFVAPQDGRVSVTGCARKADLGGGDGVRVTIRHNVGVVWRDEITSKDAIGVTHKIQLDVRKGDPIRFIVHQRGDIMFDSTYWDPEVAYEGGPRFRASEGFAAALSDAAPWRYEMEIAPDDANVEEHAVSRLYAFTSGLHLQSWNLDETTTTVRLASASHLPLAIVTRRGERNGRFFFLDAATGDWRMDVTPPDAKGQIAMRWQSSGADPRSLDYTGDWYQALQAHELEEMFRLAFKHQLRNLAVELPALPPKLWGMVTDAWRQEDGEPKTPAELAAAAGKHLERSLLLADGLTGGTNADFTAQARKAAAQLLAQARAVQPGDPHAPELYVAARRLKRELLLRRPEMSFDRLLFCKRVPPSYSHLVMQYFGWRARAGGGIFILDRPGYSLDARDILGGKLNEGSVLQPGLDWSGERIVFSYVERAGRRFQPEAMDNEKDDGCYHLWTVNTDGSGLKQLTRGAFDDLMPAWLPDGDIVFCSTRRKGYSRCFGPSFSARWHSYTLHRLSSQSGEITRLSSNDVSEWFPTIGNDGLIYYSRWDYIDRDAVTHQALWSSRPDGTNPMAVWGNALPKPHCTFQMQPIPGSRKLVLIASAHHSITGGSVVVLDPDRGENAEEAVKRITPNVPFPEAEPGPVSEWYAAPWPLAEDLFLTAYSPYPLVWEPGANRRDALGIYLLDAAGNRELLYRDPEIGATNPIPLRPRTRPPAVTSTLDPTLGDEGEFFVADVYEGLKGVVERGAVKELRVIQIFPKTTPLANTPPLGLAGEENGRAVLGTVPVASDGSVRFRAPAHKPLLFHLLDEHGRAVQIMRSLTYLQPGERMSCTGCHEGRSKVVRNVLTEAGRHEPSAIKPGPYDGKPFSFMRVAQPVLDKHCVQCHGATAPPKGIDLTGTPDRGFTRSYWALLQDIDARRQTEAGKPVEPLVPRYVQRNQIQMTQPGGQNGSRGSLLLKMIDRGHHKVSLSAEDNRRLAMWIDCNALFYGVNLPEQQKLQLAGEKIPMPAIE